MSRRVKPRQAFRRRGFVTLGALIGTTLVVMGMAVAVWSGIARIRPVDTDLRQALPAPVANGGYTTSDTCQACHPAEFESWYRSFHRTMTQPADPATVVAPFDGSILTDRGFEWRFERRGNELWVSMPDPVWFEEPVWLMQLLDERWPDEPPIIEARVVMTTGSHHMQAYWVRRPAASGTPLPGDDGSLIQVPWLWLIDEGRWVPNQDSFLTPPTRSVGGVARWNDNCAQCHSVSTEPGVDPAYTRFDTRSVELGIACEACHGPAEEHVSHYRSPWRRYLRYLGLDRDDDAADPTIVNPAKLEPDRSTEVCGQCHSFGEWRDQQDYLRSGPSFLPGDQLASHRRLIRHEPGAQIDDAAGQGIPSDIEVRFWDDGTNRVAGREYNALVASTHYGRTGLTCLSCHALHDYESRDTQLLPVAQGDGACIGCHEDYSSDPSAHSHHDEDSPGSRCMNCHMPRTTYGLFTAMRSHRIDSPSLRASLRSGRPNACNLCHLDRTLEWTSSYLESWYGEPPPDLSQEERSVAAGPRWSLAGDAGLRAITAWHMGWPAARAASGESWVPPYLTQLLTDPYAAVRLVAYRSLRELPGFRDIPYDYIATGATRGAMADEAFDRWLATGAPDAPDASVLIGADGRPDPEAWLSLLRGRDQTPIRIRE